MRGQQRGAEREKAMVMVREAVGKIKEEGREMEKKKMRWLQRGNKEMYAYVREKGNGGLKLLHRDKKRVVQCVFGQ